MDRNRYAPPATPVSDVSSGSIHMYSPEQIAGGTFFGGPFGAVYFLRANFIAMGNERLAKVTLLYGILFVIAAFGLGYVLPKGLSMPVNLAYMFMARQIAYQYQRSKQAITEDPRYKLYSNWRVVGLALICLAGSIAALFLISFIVLFSLRLIAS